MTNDDFRLRLFYKMNDRLPHSKEEFYKFCNPEPQPIRICKDCLCNAASLGTDLCPTCESIENINQNL